MSSEMILNMSVTKLIPEQQSKSGSNLFRKL